MLTSEFLVHTKHVTNFATTYTDVTSGDVGIGANVAPQFGHEALAETHDFSVGTTLRREVRTSLTTTHRKCSKSVFECLLKTEELQD